MCEAQLAFQVPTPLLHCPLLGRGKGGYDALAGGGLVQSYQMHGSVFTQLQQSFPFYFISRGAGVFAARRHASGRIMRSSIRR